MQRMPPGEFTEWEAMARLDPWGDDLANLAQAAIRETLANAWRGTNQEPYKVQDFAFDFTADPEQREADEEAARERRIDGLFAALGAMKRKGV